MKKYMSRILLVTALFLLAPAVFAQTPPIDEDALNAFGVSFSAYIMGGMMAAFGQEMPGFTMTENGDSGVIVFDNMDLTYMGDETFGYTSISGKITADEVADGVTMNADLQLSGGPVKNLKWTVENYDMTDEASEAVFTITADGKTYTMSNADFM